MGGYARAVGSYWWWLVSTVLLGTLGIVGLFNDLEWLQTVPTFVWFLGGLLCFNLAQLQAWRAIDKERKRLEAKVLAMEVKQSAIDEIAKLRRTGIVDFYANIPAQQTYPQWLHDLDKWRQQVVATLSKHFVYAIVEWFEDLGEVPGQSFEHEISPEHRHQLRMLGKELRVLEELINKNTRLMRADGP